MKSANGIIVLVVVVGILAAMYFVYKKYIGGSFSIQSANSIVSSIPGLSNIQSGVLPSQGSPTMAFLLLSPPQGGG